MVSWQSTAARRQFFAHEKLGFCSKPFPFCPPFGRENHLLHQAKSLTFGRSTFRSRQVHYECEPEIRELKASAISTKEASMYSHTDYVQAALQMQRWRDFGSQVLAYVIGNSVFVVIWAMQGGG